MNEFIQRNRYRLCVSNMLRLFNFLNSLPLLAHYHDDLFNGIIIRLNKGRLFRACSSFIQQNRLSILSSHIGDLFKLEILLIPLNKNRLFNFLNSLLLDCRYCIEDLSGRVILSDGFGGLHRGAFWCFPDRIHRLVVGRPVLAQLKGLG